MNGRIIVVDDDHDTASMMRDALRRRGLDVVEAHSAMECLEHLALHPADVVVTDVLMPGMSGLELCQKLHELHPEVLAIVITGQSALDTAIGAIRAGAYDFIAKPVKVDALAMAVARAMENLAMRREIRRLRTVASEVSDGIAGTSPAIREMVDMIGRVADSDTTVLVVGESGTGKELVARALHNRSPRRDQPFVAVNCAAMPGPLLESELFGHVKGAFTDAKRSRLGLFAQAEGGTIFLDEISEMPFDMQAKLLRVLQERTVRPVGGDEEIPVRARVVAASNRDLETEVEKRRFREDLFYRINVVAIDVPPLRARSGDVLILARHLIERIARRANKRPLGISAAAARKLVDYDWPGNIRELENYIERAVAICDAPEIGVEHLPAKVQQYQASRMEIAATPTELISLDEMERRYVRHVLGSAGGNKTHAARILGIDRRSLYRRLEEATPNPAASSR